LRRLVIEASGELAGARVLELYAGSGNFTRDLAAAGAAVTAVEEAPLAGAFAARNLAARGLADRVTLLREPVEQALSALAGARRTFDVVILDPPRIGCSPEVLAGLRFLAPRRLVYVSCDPNTLARDLGVLTTEIGLALGWAAPLDLMPQTFHIEVVAKAERSA
jgi:23S rRNA (uracil1939-C5)-methyltransferase